MKPQILFGFFVLLFFVQSAFATDNVYEKILPSTFKEECFEYKGEYNFPDENQGKYIVKIDKTDAIAVRDGYLVPIIPYKQDGEIYQYTLKGGEGNPSFLVDKNDATIIELDTGVENELILSFEKPVARNTFNLVFTHTAKEYAPHLFISQDGKEYSPVSFSEIYDFSFSFVKIIFEPRDKACSETKTCTREKIQISELSFSQYNLLQLMKLPGGGKVHFYSGYHCDHGISLDTIKVPFGIDIHTPEFEVHLGENNTYNPNIEEDKDGDTIENRKDNCPDNYNPDQKDSDSNGIGDICSDVDGDGIVGYKDNCPDVSNPDQKDINRNGVGEACEFDADGDGIFDSLDNCRSIQNQLQKDSDNDSIGDACDNCEYFNPDQEDKNGNGIGDLCEAKREELAQNDDDLDGIINAADNCPYLSNPDQTDGDNDGVGNACDNCLGVQNSDQLDFNENGKGDICEDSDGDGIEGLKDNCINVANPDQKDQDNDGIGDLCEDKDSDEIWFALDNCPFVFNPDQKDTDGDKVGDACDDTDDRGFESNKTVVIALVLILVLGLIGGIVFMFQKLGTLGVGIGSSQKGDASEKTGEFSYTKSKK